MRRRAITTLAQALGGDVVAVGGFPVRVYAVTPRNVFGRDMLAGGRTGECTAYDPRTPARLVDAQGVEAGGTTADSHDPLTAEQSSAAAAPDMFDWRGATQ